MNQRCFEAGILVRNAADTLMFSRRLITEEEIRRVFDTLAMVLTRSD